MNTETTIPERDERPELNNMAQASPVTGLLSLPPEAEATPAPVDERSEIDSTPPHPQDIPEILDPSGQFSQNWWESRPELSELGKTLKKFKSPEALAKSYAELEKIKSYPDPADEQRMKKFRSFLGLPDKEEEYKLTAPELKEGMESCWNSDLANKICSTAYKYAVPPIALQAIADAFMEEQIGYFENLDQEQNQELMKLKEDNLATLKSHWGSQCKSKLEKASHTLQQLCMEADIDMAPLAHDPVIGSNPEFIRLMEHVGKLMQDNPLKGAEKNAGTTGLSDAQRMESDPSHPLYDAYMNYNHPNHEYANSVYDQAMVNY